MVIITTVLCAGGNLKVLWKLCQWSYLTITMTLKDRYLITPISMKESRLRLLLLKDIHSEQWNRNSLLDSKSLNPDCYNDSVIKTLCENKRGSDSVLGKKKDWFQKYLLVWTTLIAFCVKNGNDGLHFVVKYLSPNS